MYNLFTDRARKVMRLANQEAERLDNEFIDTEHILRGLVKEGGGVAADVLKKLGIQLHTIRFELEKIEPREEPANFLGKLPQTPRAKKVIECAMEEMLRLKDNCVGTEHILLGLLREEGVAAQVLMNLGLRIEQVRTEIQAIPERDDDESSDVDSSQSRIIASEIPPRELDDETKRQVRQLAETLAPIQEAMEKALASQAFVEAARLRDGQDHIYKQLNGLHLPEWVIKNVKRFVHAWPKTANFAYTLDMYQDEPGEADLKVLSSLPNPLMLPLRIVVGNVPRFPISTLKAALPHDDIGSPFFQAVIPLISPNSVARFKDNHQEWVRMTFEDIKRVDNPTLGRATLLCIVHPLLLAEDVRDVVFAGIRKTGCDFVIFESDTEAHSLLGNLPSGTRLIECEQ
jgi:hypothetical protein